MIEIKIHLNSSIFLFFSSTTGYFQDFGFNNVALYGTCDVDCI